MAVLMLFRAAPGADVDAVARGLWEADDIDAVDGATPWGETAQREVAEALRTADRRLHDVPHDGEDGVLTLSTETDPGVDYEVLPHSVLVHVDTWGNAGERDRLFTDTLDALDRSAHRLDAAIWSAELDRVVDPRRDREALLQAYAAACEPADAPRSNRSTYLAMAAFVVLALLVVLALQSTVAR